MIITLRHQSNDRKFVSAVAVLLDYTVFDRKSSTLTTSTGNVHFFTVCITGQADVTMNIYIYIYIYIYIFHKVLPVPYVRVRVSRFPESPHRPICPASTPLTI